MDQPASTDVTVKVIKRVTPPQEHVIKDVMLGGWVRLVNIVRHILHCFMYICDWTNWI